MATTPTSNPIPSEAPQDLKFNAGKIDEFVTSLEKQYTDRFGVNRHTIEGLKELIVNAINNLGFKVIGNFQSGATLYSANDIIQDTSSGVWYRWDNTGTLPKSVPAGSSPESTGGVGDGKWLAVDVSDVLRRDLSSSRGATLVNAEDGRTVQQWIIANDSAEYRAKNISKLAWVDAQVHSRGSIKVLFQGDSMTAGYDMVSADSVAPENGDWARHATMTYPKRFMEYLPEQSGCAVTGVIRAISGYTAKQSVDNPEWQASPSCDVAILMLGTNDANGGSTEDVYMQSMETLIRRFINWGMGVVVQLCSNSNPANGGFLYNIWARRLRALSENYGCAYFNANEIHYYRHSGVITSDGGHFNSMGYAIHGQLLASMFMAGGLLPTYRPISNEITTWPGRMDDSIAFCDAKNTIELDRSSNFTRLKIAGTLPASKASILTFSFYLDSDAAHLYAHIQGKGPVYTQTESGWNNNAQDYYGYASNQAVNYQNNLQAEPNVALDLLPQYSPTRKFLGRILGRGWKTITIFTPLDGSANGVSVNSLTVQPIPVGFSTQARNWSRWDKGVKSVIHRKYPFSYGRSSLPPAEALTHFNLPIPQSMLPTTPAISGDVSSNFYNSGHAIMKISNTDGEYIEVLLIKISTGYNFTGKILKTTYQDANKPTGITAGMVNKNLKLLKAAFGNGAGQPQENIYNIDDDNWTAMPSVQNGGIALDVNITWPSAPPLNYWNVEVEFTDFFGSSEASI